VEGDEEKKEKKHLEKVLDNLFTKIGTPDLMVDVAYRVGRAGTTRPILIKFVKESDKIKLLQKRGVLRPEKIFVNHDLSTEDRTREKELRNKLKELKAIDNTLTGSIRDGQLLIYNKDKKFIKKIVLDDPKPKPNNGEGEPMVD